jgi:GNAT superfamily N-acetyltransferase
MNTPVSIRLNDDVRETLEVEAKARGLGLATLLREIAADAARDVRRARIRAESAAVGRFVAGDPDAQGFLHALGRPPVEGL